MSTNHNEHLRQAIALARRARDEGNHPFGALLTSAGGELLLAAGNTVTTSRDVTGHAEINLVRLASPIFEEDTLATCTLYSSTEPCAMCAGAIYWSGIGRVVYALSEQDLYRLTGSDPENPTMRLGVRAVLGAGQREVAVEGPFGIREAIEVHEGFWHPGRESYAATPERS
jgi:tRNA(Arg) A34 adenosine deaminase TadA